MLMQIPCQATRAQLECHIILLSLALINAQLTYIRFQPVFNRIASCKAKTKSLRQIGPNIKNNNSTHNLILLIHNAFKTEMIRCQHERKNPNPLHIILIT